MAPALELTRKWLMLATLEPLLQGLIWYLHVSHLWVSYHFPPGLKNTDLCRLTANIFRSNKSSEPWSTHGSASNNLRRKTIGIFIKMGVLTKEGAEFDLWGLTANIFRSNKSPEPWSTRSSPSNNPPHKTIGICVKMGILTKEGAEFTCGCQLEMIGTFPSGKAPNLTPAPATRQVVFRPLFPLALRLMAP